MRRPMRRKFKPKQEEEEEDIPDTVEEEEEEDEEEEQDEEEDFEDEEDEEEYEDEEEEEEEGGKRGRGREPEGPITKTEGMKLSIKFSIIMILLVFLVGSVLGFILTSSAVTNIDNEMRKSAFHTLKLVSIIGAKEIQEYAKAGTREEKNNALTTIRERLKKDLTPLMNIDTKQGVKKHEIYGILISKKMEGQNVLGIYSSDEKLGQTKVTKNPVYLNLAGENNEVQDFFLSPNATVTIGKEERVLHIFILTIKDTDGKTVLGEASLFMSPDIVNAVRNKMWTFTGLILLVSLILSAILSFVVAGLIASPVRKLLKDIETVSGGDLSHKTRSTSGDEIGLIARNFNAMTRELYLAQLEKIENEKRQYELSIAHEIQQGLLPKGVAKLPGYDIYAFYKPAKEVGGDYYDFLPVIGGEHLGFVVADVSGKGITGGLVMSVTRTLIKLISRNSPSPAHTLQQVNSVLAKDIPKQMFVTMLYGVLNVRTRDFLVSSAGHNPMVLYRVAKQDIELVRTPGIAVGIDAGNIFNKVIKEQPVKLETGDRVVLYTDGVVEAMNIKQEQFTDDRFYTFCRKYSTLPSKEFVETLVNELEKWRGRAEQHDDITILTFKVL